MPRVFLPFEIGNSRELAIEGDPARYLNLVLRARRGDRFLMFDSSGLHFEAEVTGVTRGSVRVSVLERLGVREEAGGGVTLLVGVLKGQKMDMVVQKSVELGAARIVPLETERTQVRETRKLQRWNKVALEAARQCGRPSPPPVEAPQGLGSFLEASGKIDGVVFYEGRDAAPLGPGDLMPDGDEGAVVAVGPEGGFTSAEVELMAAHGLKARTLGANILRAETAAIAAVTLAQYLMGRMGNKGE